MSDFEKMLRYHEMTSEEFFDLGVNEQRRLKWNYNKFGRNSC